MTAPTEQFVQITQRSQEAVTTAVRNWTDSLQACAGSITDVKPQLPDVNSAVDTAFDLAAQLLTRQREYAKTLLAAGAQAAEAITEQARAATVPFQPVAPVAETVPGAPKPARAARNGVTV
ncbi:hypothetical protein ACVGVM_12970 [Pseudonocardia bannensis]|uniref:Uncharacterized protein n=1 Tax=Pseudonocardia bannensis TaxID=630973 RepID=A0A848DSA5_9PSEU|nr:hypothetical protein [Pseudonocardia bannensis]NMH95618.1 hypothetical protein [Pseudonocardia bannensis]